MAEGTVERRGRGPAPATRWRRVALADRCALIALAVIPILLEAPFLLARTPVLPGDDLVQNYPLRVYVGEVIRSGHLPGWDPFIWSGTPLLAGWNAGAMFPGTWLFAVLPGDVAWSLNLILVGVVGGVGTYLFLRQLSIGALASFLAALVATYTGFMSGQVAHIGLVEGTAFLPLLLLGIDGMARGSCPTLATRERALLSPLGSGVVAAIAGACTMLAGDPRAVSTAVIAAALYTAAWVIRARRGTGRFLLAVVASGALAAICSAAQWLPGIAFLRASQRGESAYAFFSAGSLGLGQIGALLALPFGLGGNGNLGLPLYSGDYNLTETTIGVGIVALVAAFALLPEAFTPLVRRVHPSRSFGPHLAPPNRSLVVWYVTALVGVVLTMGSNTYLSRILVTIPFFGGERLQNRNAEILDFALVVLLAYFLDSFAVRSAPRRARALDPLDPLERGVGRGFALVPLAWLVGLAVCSFLAPDVLENLLGVLEASPAILTGLDPYEIAMLVLGSGLALLVIGWTHVSKRWRYVAIVAFTVADVASFVVNSSFADEPLSLLGASTPLSTALFARTGPTDRFAIYNPAYEATGNDAAALSDIGVSDLNILRHLSSVQGYGSIVDGTYQNATDTHQYEALNAPPLATTTFDTLDLNTLLTLPGYLDAPLARGSAIPVAGGHPVTVHGNPAQIADVPPELASTTGPWKLGRGTSMTWILPTRVTVVRATIVVSELAGARPSTLTVGVAPITGFATTMRVPVRNGIAELELPRARVAERIIVTNRSTRSALIGAVVAVTRHPDERLLLDGSLQGILAPPHWRLSTPIGPFVVFTNEQARGSAWLQSPTSRTPSDSIDTKGSVTTGAKLTTGAETMVVVAHRPVLLVRSTTYAPGWVAKISELASKTTRPVPVRQFGLVQAIELPAGSFKVSWQYAPDTLVAGSFVSCIGAIIMLAVVALCIRRARRNRPNMEVARTL